MRSLLNIFSSKSASPARSRLLPAGGAGGGGRPRYFDQNQEKKLKKLNKYKIWGLSVVIQSDHQGRIELE